MTKGKNTARVTVYLDLDFGDKPTPHADDVQKMMERQLPEESITRGALTAEITSAEVGSVVTMREV